MIGRNHRKVHYNKVTFRSVWYTITSTYIYLWKEKHFHQLYLKELNPSDYQKGWSIPHGSRKKHIPITPKITYPNRCVFTMYIFVFKFDAQWNNKDKEDFFYCVMNQYIVILSTQRRNKKQKLLIHLWIYASSWLSSCYITYWPFKSLQCIIYEYSRS